MRREDSHAATVNSQRGYRRAAGTWKRLQTTQTVSTLRASTQNVSTYTPPCTWKRFQNVSTYMECVYVETFGHSHPGCRQSSDFRNVSTSAKCAHVETFLRAPRKTFPRRHSGEPFPRQRKCADVETLPGRNVLAGAASWKRFAHAQNVSTSRAHGGCFHVAGITPRGNALCTLKTFPRRHPLQNVSLRVPTERFHVGAFATTWKRFLDAPPWKRFHVETSAPEPGMARRGNVLF